LDKVKLSQLTYSYTKCLDHLSKDLC
jgi:hypothetical protein